MRYVGLGGDNLRSHFVFRPRHAPEWLRAWFLLVVFLTNEEELTGKTFTTSLTTTNPNTHVKFIFLRTSPLTYKYSGHGYKCNWLSSVRWSGDAGSSSTNLSKYKGAVEDEEQYWSRTPSSPEWTALWLFLSVQCILHMGVNTSHWRKRKRWKCKKN